MLALPQDSGAQTVRLVPRDRLYRVAVASGVTVEVIDPRRSESDPLRVVAAEAAATADATSLALDGAAGQATGDDYTIPLATTTGLAIGHTYLLRSADQRSEGVVISSIYSANSAQALGPIRQSFASADVLLGVEWSVSIPEAAFSVEDGAGPLLVIWRYTLAGESYVLPQPVFASRYSTVPPITDAELAAANPARAREIAASGNTLAQAIAVAMDDYLGELEALRIDPQHTILPRAGKLAVREKALEYCADWANDEAARDRHAQAYRHQMNTIRLGMPPLGTVEIQPVTNTAEPGSSKRTRSFFRRS